MIYIDALSIFSIFKTCNRFNQFLKLIKKNIDIRNPLIFFSHRMKFSYFGKNIRSIDHVGRNEENYRNVSNSIYRNCRNTNYHA